MAGKRRSIADVDNDIAQIKEMIMAMNAPKEPEPTPAEVEHNREFGDRFKVVESSKSVSTGSGELPSFTIREDIAAWVRDIARNRAQTERPGWTVENELALIVKHSFHASKHAFEAENSKKNTVSGESV